MFSPTAQFVEGVPVSRLDSFLRRIVAALPWYDVDVVEGRHARTEEVRQHSIKARRGADAEVTRHDDVMRGSFGRMGRRLAGR